MLFECCTCNNGIAPSGSHHKNEMSSKAAHLCNTPCIIYTHHPIYTTTSSGSVADQPRFVPGQVYLVKKNLSSQQWGLCIPHESYNHINMGPISIWNRTNQDNMHPGSDYQYPECQHRKPE